MGSGSAAGRKQTVSLIDLLDVIGHGVAPNDNKRGVRFNLPPAPNLCKVENSPALLAALNEAKAGIDAYIPDYKPMQVEVRRIEADIRENEKTILTREDDIKLTRDQGEIDRLTARIDELRAEQETLKNSIPAEWEAVSAEFKTLNGDMVKARRNYQNNVDTAYSQLTEIEEVLAGTDTAATLAEPLQALALPLESGEREATMAKIKEVESLMSSMTGVSKVKSLLSKARRALKKGEDQRAMAIEHYQAAGALFEQDLAWRKTAQMSVLPQLSEFKASLNKTVGLRSQKRLTVEQAKFVARCQSTHDDISIYF